MCSTCFGSLDEEGATGSWLVAARAVAADKTGDKTLKTEGTRELEACLALCDPRETLTEETQRSPHIREP